MTMAPPIPWSPGKPRAQLGTYQSQAGNSTPNFPASTGAHADQAVDRVL